MQRILIIDDMRDSSYPLRRLLELAGKQVEVAADGRTGLQLAREFMPEVVLCDIGLPGELDGFAVMQALRQEHADRPLYAVALTGYDQDQARSRARAAGFDFHVTKPVGKALLDELIERRPCFSDDVTPEGRPETS